MIKSIDVSIIIVSYNVCDLITKCIESIYEKIEAVTFEVIVVDNASVDNTVEKIRVNFPEVKLIASNVNLGFGKANNLGASQAIGKYLFFLNPDTELINDAVSELYLFMETHLDVALCGANLFTPSMQPNKSYEMFLPGFVDALAYIFNISIPQNEDKFNASLTPKPVVLIGGADMFMRHFVFDKVGGFDERYFMYFEEPIFSYKIQKLQLFLYSVPTAHIIHHEGASNKKKTITTYYFFDSFLKYYHDYYPSAYWMIFYLFKLKVTVALFLSSLLHNEDKCLYWSKIKKILLDNK